MKIFEVKERIQELVNTLLEVWENSVKATHLFLSDNEIEKIKIDREIIESFGAEMQIAEYGDWKERKIESSKTRE